MALTKARLIEDNAIKAVHIDETATGITMAELTINGDLTVTGNIDGYAKGYVVNIINTNTSAVNNNLYVITADLILTLPQTPTVGDKIAVSNQSGLTTPVIARNNEKIQGLAEDMVLDIDGSGIELLYTGILKGWIII